ncbi:MAG: hypothetical protein JW723_06440 [Bacteroidales bacterium]|nr:hypothetical protein [Bacteroidales bacterium]
MRKSLLVFVILSFSAPVFLQMPDLNFTTIPNEEKLSSTFANCIEQDTTGYIWIGTTEGLNRFDGYEITVYKHEPDDSTSLINNNIRCLFNDSRDRLWIGSNSGLCIYNRTYDCFDRIVNTFDSSGIEGISISHIAEDQKNSIYVSSGNDIYFFDKEKTCFHKFLTVSHGEISSFIFDDNNHLWIGSFPEGGLLNYNTDNKEFTRYVHDEADVSTISSNSLMSVALKDGDVWIATFGGGINRLNIKTGHIKRYPASDSYEIYAKKVYTDRNNNLWTCDLTGLKYHNQQSDVFYGYYYNEEDPYTIKKTVVSIFQDRQGNYWTLHSPGGVGISMVSKGFISFSDSPAEYWRTSNENISAIYEDASGNLWLGNPNNGIDVFYWSKGKTVTYLYDPDDKYSLGKGSVNTIYRDRNNRMWVGTYFGGLQYFDESSGRFISYVNNPDDTNSIACNDVRSVCEDQEGNLWIVVHGKGVDKFDREENKFHHHNNLNNKLSNDWAFQVICDDNNDIWVATVWGFNRLDKSNDTFLNYLKEENNHNSLSSNNLSCLYKDDDNNIWIGTDNGLSLYNRNEDRIVRINVALKNNHISAILEDKEKNIWISTAGGLAMINPGTLKTINFDVKDGLLANEFNPRSAYKNDINGLFFGSIKGVNVFNPDSLKINKEKPHVVISHFSLFYEDVLEYSAGSVLKKHISLTDTIILKYKQNIITFKFAALNMIQPQKNQYAYMMEGFDSRWNYVGNKREATYTNLSPGRYYFRVKASNNDGYWNEEGAAIFVRVKPPWYRTWLFYIMAVLSVLGIFTLFYFVRTTRLRKQKDILALKVRERTSELSEKNEELKTQAEELNNTNALLEERQQMIEEQAKNLEKANDDLKKLNSSKDKFFSIIAHDLRSPFQSILGLSEVLTDNFADMADSQRNDVADNINASAKKIFGLLENLLKWAASQTNKISFKPEILDIEDIIKDSIIILGDLAKKKSIEIRIKDIKVKRVFADKDMVKTIVRNLAGNALKYTLKGGSVEFEVTRTNGFACISVKDNGIGMDQKYIRTLFSIDKMESRPGTEKEQGSGLGLILCKEFAEKNGGKMAVESKKGSGSRFSFTLPLPPGQD